MWTAGARRFRIVDVTRGAAIIPHTKEADDDPHSTRRVAIAESAAAMALATSVLLLLASFSLWLVLMFWMAGSKLLPPTGSRLIDWMREDEYYAFLVPLTVVPVALLANYVRWFTNSLFLTNEW